MLLELINPELITTINKRMELPSSIEGAVFTLDVEIDMYKGKIMDYTVMDAHSEVMDKDRKTVLKDRRNFYSLDKLTFGELKQLILYTLFEMKQKGEF